MDSKLLLLFVVLAIVVPTLCEETTVAPAAVDEDADQKFSSTKKWHKHFEERSEGLRAAIPNESASDYKSEQTRLDILKRFADLAKRTSDVTANRNDFLVWGESRMRDLENRLNDVGRRAFPMTWKSIKCGLKGRNLYDCGKAPASSCPATEATTAAA